MNSNQLIDRLHDIHDTLTVMFDGVSEDEYRDQHHNDLSPLGWHIGHTLFIENMWLHERVMETQVPNQELLVLYIPENCSRSERKAQLPPKDEALHQIRNQQRNNIDLLRTMPEKLLRHELMRENYLLKFLIQHHAQHIETMRMVKTQSLSRKAGRLNGQGLKQPASLVHSKIRFDITERAFVGGDDKWAFDNELPRKKVSLKAFSINQIPVTNAQYLAFIEAGGYRENKCWGADGWRWLAESKVTAPDGWFRDGDKGWYQACCDGNHILTPDSPVHGVSHYEARAFAAFAGARLPHEYEWEIAARAGQLAKIHHVWEWCDNTFHPYHNFRPFPYPEYSVPSFDKKHYTLRGASRFSEAELRRLSFRNFYTRDKRHIFAGIRLAFDEQC